MRPRHAMTLGLAITALVACGADTTPSALPTKTVCTAAQAEFDRSELTAAMDRYYNGSAGNSVDQILYQAAQAYQPVPSSGADTAVGETLDNLNLLLSLIITEPEKDLDVSERDGVADLYLRLLNACSGKPTETVDDSASTTFLLQGQFQLLDQTSCISPTGYDDITDGAQVTVYDDTGKIVGLGEISDPRYRRGSCEYSVVVEDVPRGPAFYQVEISHRGRLTVRAEDAEAGDFFGSLGG